MFKDIVNSYYNQIREFPTLTVDEERDLAEKIKEGNTDAIDHLVHCNLRLVMKISHDFKSEGVPLMDLIQEGNIGLITAAKKFEPSKGKFSTYAAWWIKRHMRNAVYKQSSFNLIEIPQYIAARISDIKKMAENFNGEEADFVDYVVENSNYKKSKIVQDINSDKAKRPFSTEEMKEEIGIEPCEKTDIIKDICDRDDMYVINGILNSLSERDRTVVQARYGLNGEKPQSLKEIGNQFNLTPERIRQIQKCTLQAIKESFSKENVYEIF